MTKRSRADRHSIPTNPEKFLSVEESRGAWAETEQEILDGIRWGHRKEFLLAWVRMQMGERLTEREAPCLTMRYFEGKTYDEVAEAIELPTPTAHRIIMDAISALRKAALENPPSRYEMKQRRVKTKRQRPGAGNAHLPE